jgi:hypothetical protein
MRNKCIEKSGSFVTASIGSSYARRQGGSEESPVSNGRGGQRTFGAGKEIQV